MSDSLNPPQIPLLLVVETPDGFEIALKLLPTTPLFKLMKAVCDRQGYNLQFATFSFNNKVVQPTDTPIMLGMKNMDEIKCSYNHKEYLDSLTK
jgi:hypothetical protein